MQTYIQGFDKQIVNLTGDTLVAAGALAYLGAFTNEYREELIQTWLSSCEDHDIKTTENYSLITILVDAYEIRLWNTYGLPRDKVSTENAIFVTQASRWPLMIDPQEQVIVRSIVCKINRILLAIFHFHSRRTGGYVTWNMITI